MILKLARVLSILGLMCIGGLFCWAQQDELITRTGRLEVHGNRSIIFGLTGTSPSWTAFWFINKSATGRKILSKCSNGETCKFTGRVGWYGGTVGQTETRGQIYSVKRVQKVR